MPDRIKVAVVDDEPRLLAAWSRLVQMQADLECVGSLRDAGALRDQIEQMGADIVLLDLTMPGEDPIVVLKELTARSANCRVLAFSGRSDSATQQSVLDAGGWGLVDKIADPDVVLNAIRQVSRGELYLSARL